MAQSEPDRLSEDDLLKGFDETAPSRGKLGGFFAVTIAASLFAWNTMFDLGAYHVAFYRTRHQLFVLSLVVLLGGLAMRRRAHTNPWLLDDHFLTCEDFQVAGDDAPSNCVHIHRR